MSNNIKVYSKRKKNIIVMGVVVPLTAIVLLIVSSIFATIHFANVKKSAIETTATISKIEVVTTKEEESGHGRGETEVTTKHIVYVDYVIDGKNYNNVKLNIYNAGMRVGDKVQIYCNAENPAKMVSTTNVGLIILIVLLIGTGIYAVILPTVILRNNIRIKKLLRNGECHRVPIVDVFYNYMQVSSSSGKSKRVKIGQYLVAKYNGNGFTSEEIKMTDEGVFNGCTIDLYLDRAEAEKSRRSRVKQFRKRTGDVGNYYLDINSIQKDELDVME